MLDAKMEVWGRISAVRWGGSKLKLDFQLLRSLYVGLPIAARRGSLNTVTRRSGVFA